MRNTVFCLVILMASSAFANLDYLQPATIATRLRNEIAKQKIAGDANLVNIDVFNGLSIAAKYHLQSEPSYVDGYYTRMDQYTFGADINPGDILSGLGVPLTFGIKRGTDIIFARQFHSQKDSLLALPYTFLNFPLTAERAREKLAVGDFVAFQTNLNLVVSLGASFTPTPIIQAGASVQYYISGQFMIHIFKMPNDHVRIKFIAIRGRGEGLGASAGVAGSLTVARIDVVNRLVNSAVHRWINFTPISLSVDQNINDLFMLDYVFDLRDPKAAAIYDAIMLKKSRFKEAQTANPFASRNEIQKKLITDISDAEDLFQEDRSRPPAERRIDRVFKGSNSSSGNSTRFKIGLNILHIENGTSFSQNKVLSYDKNDQPRYFLLDTYSADKTFKFFFDLFGDSTTTTSNLLLNSTADWVPTDFVALTGARETRMKNVSRRDYRQVQEHVRSLIPSTEYSQIQWHDWDFSRGDLVNGYVKSEVLFQPEALQALPRMSTAEAYQLFANYVARFGSPNVQPYFGENDPEERNRSWQEKFDGDFRYIGRYFAIAFNPAYRAQDRYESFLKLKKFPIWEERGIGFILSLLPPENLSRLITYNFVFSAKGAPTISYQFGNFAEEALYRNLLYIQSVINNRSFDLRLYTGPNGELSLSQATPMQ